jgi:Eukaryotic initiation factor 4E
MNEHSQHLLFSVRRPVVEDDHNIEGGRFLLDHLCLKKVTFEDFNSYWFNIIAFMMKCYMPAGLGINGAVVRVRPHRKTIAIWIKDGEDVELITCVEKFLREKFCLKHVQYARHRELECKAEIRKKKKEGQRVVPVIPESEDPRTFTVMTFVTFVDDTKQ